MIAGAAAAPPARTTTVPALAIVAVAPAPPAPAASQLAQGIGTTAVAALRTATRARWTSWRIAVLESPRSRATSSCPCPSIAVRSSASR